jgi:hypothetical protein
LLAITISGSPLQAEPPFNSDLRIPPAITAPEGTQ